MSGPWHRRKLSRTTHLHDISRSVTILRERHPFEGRSLQIMGTIKRRGTLLLLVVLPDGSRSLIPASWTDWYTGADGAPESAVALRELCMASLADLLSARVLVDALLSRCLIPQATSAVDE